jgi:hypothetical protein
MAEHARRCTTGTLLLCALLTAALRAQSDDVSALVARTAAYAQDYGNRLTNVVCEERQTQQIVEGDGRVKQQRTLRSDVLIVKSGTFAPQLFRDVIDVDGKPVRDREKRVSKLFLERTSPDLDQWKRVASEGARYNIGTKRRAFDGWWMTMALLRREPAAISGIRFAKTDEGFRFDEEPTPGRPATRGRLQGFPLFAHVDVAIGPEGQVRRSTLLLDNPQRPTRFTAEVEYKENPELRLLLPTEVREQFAHFHRRGNERLDVSSSYSKCREFQVSTEEHFVLPEERRP